MHLLSLLVALVAGQPPRTVDEAVRLAGTGDYLDFADVSPSAAWKSHGAPKCKKSHCCHTASETFNKTYVETNFRYGVAVDSKGYMLNVETLSERIPASYAGSSTFIGTGQLHSTFDYINRYPKLSASVFLLSTSITDVIEEADDKLDSVKRFMVRVVAPEPTISSPADYARKLQADLTAFEEKFPGKVLIYCHQKDMDYTSTLNIGDFYVQEIFDSFPGTPA